MLLSTAINLFFTSLIGIVSNNTIAFYKSRLPSLLHFLGDIPIDSITLDDLRSWRSSLATRKIKYTDHPFHPPVYSPLSPYTIRQYVNTIRRFFSFCFDDHIITSNPALLLKAPPKPDIPRKGILLPALNQIISAASNSCNRDLAIVLFLADTACRVGGLSNLSISNIDIINHSAIVFEKGKGGSSKRRTVFFSDHTALIISRLLTERPPDYLINPAAHDYLLLTNRKSNGLYNQLSENGIRLTLKRLAASLSIIGFNPHNFRHAAIRGWLSNGMPLSLASQLAGHSSISITVDIYGTANDFELSEAHKSYGLFTHSILID
jgi:integrase